MSQLAALPDLDVRSVAVFRALQLGEMLCAVPALRALRAALPQARIVLIGLPWAREFATRFSRYLDAFEAFPGHPDLPEQPVPAPDCAAFYASMRAQRFSLALQLHGSGSTTNPIVASLGAHVLAGFTAHLSVATRHLRLLHYPDEGAEPDRLLYLTSWLGAPAQGNALEFPLTLADSEALNMTELPDRLAGRPYLCIHARARGGAGCWPVQRYAEVADTLAREFGLVTVVTGSAAERQRTQALCGRMRTPVIDAAGPMPTGAMAALMQGARLLVCSDHGVSQMAAGLGLKSVVVFSNGDPQRWAPAPARRHRCVCDPSGEKSAQVLDEARDLLGPEEVPIHACSF